MTELEIAELGEAKRVDTGLRQRQHLTIERVVFNQPELNEDYEGGPRVLKTPKERWQLFRKKNELTPGCFGRFLLSYLPFIEIMKKYNIKRDVLPDVVAGLTVGIMQIPQGMAYAVLASMDAVYGLYMSFFPIIVYFFFGTSRHLSFGTFAVISLMVGSAVDRVCGSESETYWLKTENGTSSDCAIEVASALTFTGGLMQIGMSFLHLGFVVIYLSEPMTRGFTTGCSIHVFSSQLKGIFGVSIPRHSGALKLIYTYRDLILALPQTNPAAVIASVISAVLLWVTKEYLNPPVKKRLKAPIPIDLVVVVLGTAISYYANFEEKYGLEVIGEVPTGLPAPTMPPVKYFSETAMDGFVIAIVAYAISISMAQNFAEKNGYSVDANQELLAHGITNFVCSNFKCYMMSVSLSRSLVQETLGGVTQIAGLVAALLMLIVLVALAGLFEALPSCVLAAIIVVALKGMFLQMKDIPKLWGISKTDLSVWMVTFLAVVILDIDLGLLVGVFWSFLTVIGRTQRPYVCDMGRIGETDMYGDKRTFETASDVPGVKIVRFESSVYFANRDYFIDRVFLKARCQPKVLATAMKKAYKKRTKAIKKNQKDGLVIIVHNP
ncbi:hypothetical protein CAPTEDRAFT_122476 [Capitella teleta]|uniref:SLC26A/SulP transporter domain-containing protein n=1 Tax=Capitella teleta TaxID=283909 RepID=R7UIC8_CAPTE|nr:hypothetical protein CAPTEDRAFT_122476 [Capitella teleta]|eukprot:ELU06319.1 hypothetical protein CAPTEDRAFT_122476 [Capitella teleta]